MVTATECFPEQTARPSAGAAADTRRIAWDDIAFEVPANWELAAYHYARGDLVQLSLEDELAVRMEVEWIRPQSRRDIRRMMQSYQQSARKLTSRAATSGPVEGLKEGWSGAIYTIRESAVGYTSGSLRDVEHVMVTASFCCPEDSLICFIKLHFLPGDHESPEGLLQLISASFRHFRDTPMIPWELYDIEFDLPRHFVLERTHFDIGAKLMVFRWKHCRLHLWHFSCADMFLKEGTTVQEWVTGYLNGFGGIKGPVFSLGPDGEIQWRRRARYGLAHREEASRWCRNYRIGYRRDLERNQLVVWVYNFRSPRDLAMLPATPASRHGMEEQVAS
jgi:hypothetical protein